MYMMLSENKMDYKQPLLKADPRKPERPDGEAGSNWARCRECGRGGYKISLIRHAKHCRSR